MYKMVSSAKPAHNKIRVIEASPIETILATWLNYNFRSDIIKSFINYYSFISFLISTDHPVLHQIHCNLNT